MFYSDGTQQDHLPQSFLDAKYMINIGCLKQHDCAGVTFCAKNHFGSMCRQMAGHLHYALPSPSAGGFGNIGYGKYRNLVDLMQHKDLGEKTFLFIIDGLWGGELPVCDPIKWQSAPFNDDWPSSIMISQDHVAIESVGTDFVMAEFPEYSTMLGSDDYLHQAADSANWADSIMYDPDGDGIYIASLGVHEHWNNNIEKLYTRNLGTGDGIELVQMLITDLPEDLENQEEELSIRVFPNPCTDIVNLQYQIPDTRNAPRVTSIVIYGTDGKIVYRIMKEMMKGEHELEINVSSLPPGMYFVRLQAGELVKSGKFIKNQ
jgi:hypothetical protein